jgi:hypothetical protein
MTLRRRRPLPRRTDEELTVVPMATDQWHRDEYIGGMVERTPTLDEQEVDPRDQERLGRAIWRALARDVAR